jgi:hypothetical protein
LLLLEQYHFIYTAIDDLWKIAHLNNLVNAARITTTEFRVPNIAYVPLFVQVEIDGDVPRSTRSYRPDVEEKTRKREEQMHGQPDLATSFFRIDSE